MRRVSASIFKMDVNQLPDFLPTALLPEGAINVNDVQDFETNSTTFLPNGSSSQAVDTNLSSAVLTNDAILDDVALTIGFIILNVITIVSAFYK